MLNTNPRIKKLYTLLEATRQHMLGLDWESKIEYKAIEKKIIDQIKFLEQDMPKASVVK